MTEGMYGIMDSCSREKLLMMAANKWKALPSGDEHTFLSPLICLNSVHFTIKFYSNKLGTVGKQTCSKSNQFIIMTKDKAKPRYPHFTDRAQKVKQRPSLILGQSAILAYC